MTAGDTPTSTDPALVVEIPLRWSDMDAYGHVNNATFVTLLEQARIIALDEWYGHGGLLDAGLVVSNQEVDYLAQLPYRTTPVAARVWCSHIGASSFTMACELRDPEGYGDTRYCLAETTLVRFDAAAGHSRRLSEDERAVLEEQHGDPAPLHRRRKAAR
ncbi:acyl-CoA thioesterase [Mobilicoccus pelagius]|uniref:Uncharacterized protein n=1 Tax=Mobilicoccus pelagius NBRC 104925 TaxID=1089455 RepID=H5UVC2_9MICO|nr:acyl-CoA thioesterase [Mobilicoccus pelagius]GAB49680.1 hypothetical protein MOPEL_132_00470 [Mobilicoccus pelagius NBRC 104925]